MRTQALLRVPLPLCPANLALQRSNLTMLSHLSAFPSRVLSVSLCLSILVQGVEGGIKTLLSTEELLVVLRSLMARINKNESRVILLSD